MSLVEILCLCFYANTQKKNKRKYCVAYGNNLLVVNEKHIASFRCKCMCVCANFAYTTLAHYMRKLQNRNLYHFWTVLKSNHIISFSIISKAQQLPSVRSCMHACMHTGTCIICVFLLDVSCLTNKTSKFLPELVKTVFELNFFSQRNDKHLPYKKQETRMDGKKWMRMNEEKKKEGK